ncbi:hypothetical protein TSAR_004832 [Trichomalopsis sarcophagae]|uniref:DUF5641 domain-containing protein n=1 Tax=Trichomalopsis sarcophagae TaxID=543379 RepID=A0A232EPM8_9HYME|nr:hypothetical protein TSAR_004832 [Trichomalopsis sarcophagae]
MLTTLIDCEAVINSRPLTFISEGYEEAIPISPSMFLQEVKEIGALYHIRKIKQLVTGKDGNVRVVITESGEITRPIQRLYPLELNFNCNDEDERQTVKENIKTVIERKSNANVQVKETKTKSGRISKQPERLTYT